MNNPKRKNTQTRTVPIAFLAFIGLGMTSGLLGLAWPSMRQEFGLPLDSVKILFVVQTAAYTVASFSIGRLMARFGSGVTLLTGMALMGLTMFGLAASSQWVSVIAVILVFGFGSGVLDAGLNLYMATYHSARQMSWLHASFGVGITIAPLIMTAVLQREFGWHAGYAIVGIILIPIIMLLAFTRRLWRREGFQTAEDKPVLRASFGATLRLPTVWFGMATFLAYVGVEIGIGQWAYTVLTQSRGIDTGTAGILVSIYWGVFTGGRIFFGIVANRFKIESLLRCCMLGVIVGAGLFWWNPIGVVGILGLLIIGAAQAPVFPLLMTATAQRVGLANTDNTISLQMGAVGIGSAILPGLIGTIGENYGLEKMTAAFAIMAVVVFIFHELTLPRFAGRQVLSTSGD